MPKGVENKRYPGEFKQMVVEDMINNKLSCRETEQKYNFPKNRATAWKRIYLEK